MILVERCMGTVERCIASYLTVHRYIDQCQGMYDPGRIMRSLLLHSIQKKKAEIILINYVISHNPELREIHMRKNR